MVQFQADVSSPHRRLTSQEEEQNGEGEEQQKEGHVKHQGGNHEDESVDAPQGEQHLLPVGCPLEDAGTGQDAKDGIRQPEAAIGGESGGSKCVLSLEFLKKTTNTAKFLCTDNTEASRWYRGYI